MDERIKEPTAHQRSLAKMLRAAADALDCGEVTRSVVTIHYGQIEVENDFHIGDFRLKKRDLVKRVSTGNRAISVVLQYCKDVPTDLIADIAKQECMT